MFRKIGTSAEIEAGASSLTFIARLHQWVLPGKPGASDGPVSDARIVTVLGRTQNLIFLFGASIFFFHLFGGPESQEMHVGSYDLPAVICFRQAAALNIVFHKIHKLLPRRSATNCWHQTPPITTRIKTAWKALISLGRSGLR